MRAFLVRPFGRGHRMLRNRLTYLLLLAATALLLAACTTPTDGLLATQGFGHFNAKSVNISFDSGGSSLLAQSVVVGPGVQTIFVNGIAQGIGNDDYRVDLLAEGNAEVTCTNQGGNEAPGQNPAVATLSQGDLDPTPKSDRNGRYVFDVNNGDQIQTLSFAVSPCPNDNWEARLDFVDWNKVTLLLVETSTTNTAGQITDVLEYTCVTDRNALTIDCDLVKGKK